MALSFRFRHPLGSGYLTEALPSADGVNDGYFSAQEPGEAAGACH